MMLCKGSRQRRWATFLSLYIKLLCIKNVCSIDRCHVRLFVTSWTVDCQAPLSIEFSRQEHQSWWPFSTPGDLSDPGIESMPPAFTGRIFTIEPPGKSTCVKNRERLQSHLSTLGSTKIWQNILVCHFLVLQAISHFCACYFLQAEWRQHHNTSFS